MPTKFVIWGLMALALTGCISQSQIQAKYVKSQNICRAETGRLFAGRESLNPAQAQAAMASGFTECMTKAGWRSAPKVPAQVAQNSPTGSPSTNPLAATSSARQQPLENPPSGAPSTAPSAAAARQAAPVAASPSPAPSGSSTLPTYRPARPTTVPDVTFGKGPGRQF